MASPIPNQRHPKLDDPYSTASSSASSNSNIVNNSTSKRKWMPFLVALMVISQIAFLSRLDMSKNTELINTWADSFYQFTSSSLFPTSTYTDGPFDAGYSFRQLDMERSCEEWLENQDYINYSRDFDKEPVLINGDHQELMSCSVRCKFGYDSDWQRDATIGLIQGGGLTNVLLSMESSHYYAENNIDIARRRGYNIVMTTSLSSDVPVGYFSWAEYDIMAQVQPKTEDALAAAFISNCGARNFRLQALEALERGNIKIDSYGTCHRNRDERVDKVEALKHYKFSLAFENSNEEDYVTEKFFQSLVAGSIPVVVGAPNIHDFAPMPGSILHIKELKDADSVAEKMKYLAEKPSAYNESLRWKFEGPSDSFKALVDMAAVHSSCRLCIYIATNIRKKEETSRDRPCKCRRGVETVYHVYVRERGRFEMESIFLRSGNLTKEALEYAVLTKFKSMKHVPIWKNERPEKIRGSDELRVYRIYPYHLTQRQALFTFKFTGNDDFRQHIQHNPCPKFEVIFV